MVTDVPSPIEEDSPESPNYDDVTSKLQELPGVFPYPQQVMDTSRKYKTF